MNQATVFEALIGRAVSTNDRAARLLWEAAIIISASLVIFASSRLSVPFYPVPLTMQSIAVILLALVLGPRLATGAAVLYFGQCLAIPGFSAGPMAMTGGYVLGFVAAAATAGYLYRRGHGRSLGTGAVRQHRSQPRDLRIRHPLARRRHRTEQRLGSRRQAVHRRRAGEDRLRCGAAPRRNFCSRPTQPLS